MIQAGVFYVPDSLVVRYYASLFFYIVALIM